MTDTPTEREAENPWTKLRRRKVAQWGIAYVAGAWGFLQGLEYVSDAFHWPEQLRQVAILALLIGLPITLVVAWYHGDRGEQRVGGTELAILTLLFLLGGGLFWRYERADDRSSVAVVPPAPVDSRATASDTRPSVAVIPFTNLTNDPADDYLAEGIAETLLTMLAQVTELRVIGRASSFSFKDRNEDARSIGEKLGVDALLAGSVQRAGDHIRVSARIVSTKDGTQIWAAAFDRPASDIFAVQDEIANNVAKALSITLAGKAGVGAIGTTNIAAYDSYLRGKQLIERRESATMEEGVLRLKRAVALDASFARAWAELSKAYLSGYGGGLVAPGQRSVAQATALAGKAARRAVDLAPTSGFSHDSLARYLSWNDQDADALASASRAVELSPDDTDCLLTLAGMLRFAGRAQEAMLPTRRALALDPRNWRMRIAAGQTFDANGDMRGALAQYGEAIRLEPEIAQGYIFAGLTLSYMVGREDEALRFLERAAVLDPGNLNTRRRLLIGYLSIGDDRSAARILEHLKETDTNAGYRLALARQHYIAGRVSEDRRLVLQVLDEAPESDQALFALAVISRAPAEATYALNRILERYPEFLDKPQPWHPLDHRVCLLAWSGELDRAREVVAEVESDWRRRNAFSIATSVAERGTAVARSLSCVGRNDEALAELELLLKEGFDLYGWQHVAFDPAFEPLRNHPRFKSVLMQLKSAAKLEYERFRARPDLGDADIEALGR